MSCTVKERLIDTIKDEIKGKATSYTFEKERVFIPVSNVTKDKITSKNNAFKTGERIVNKLNLQYKPFTKSDIVSLDSTPKEGVYINIHPDSKVVAAYEYHELQEESGYYDKQVGQTTLFQTSKKSGYSESLEAGLEWAKKVFPNSDVKLVEGLIQDIARGSYNSVEDVISASKQFADKGTIKHEFGHKAFAALTEKEREDLLNEGSKLFNIPRGEGKSVTKFQQVDYQFKVVDKIKNSISRIERLWNQIKDKEVFWKKIQQELGIPKEQIELLKNSEGNSIEEKLTNFLANYSYTIEINTAKNILKSEIIANLENNEHPLSFTFIFNDYEYELFDGRSEGHTIEYSKRQKDSINRIYIEKEEYDIALKQAKNVEFELKDTQHYSALTVPGGTNYTENAIQTPNIINISTAHLKDFANGIANMLGWFRSDDKLDNIKYELATSKHNTDEHRFSYGEFIKNKNSVRVTRNVEGDYSIHEGDLSDLSKSKRIKLFEKQSSVIPIGGKIVQRGASSFDGIRHRINLKNHGFSIEYGTDNLQEYKSTDKNAVQEFSNTYNLGSVIEKNGKLFTKGVILTKNIDIKSSTKTRRILEVQSDLFQKGRDEKKALAWNRYILDSKGDVIGENPNFQSEQDFLNLLRKDSNWVTFFIKSIIQDSAKKGYEKVLFPRLDTIIQIESQSKFKTYEEAEKFYKNPDWIKRNDEAKKKLDEARALTEQSERFIEVSKHSKYDFKEWKNNAIQRAYEEWHSLQPTLLNTANFYEYELANRLDDIVGGNKNNRAKGIWTLNQITDEYGNTWNEVEIKPEMANETIKLQTSKLEYSGDLAIEEKIMEMMEKSPDRVIVKSAIGKFFQKLKQFLRDVFNSRDKIGNFIKDVNEGRFSERKIQNISKEVKFQKADNDWNDNQGSAFEQQQRFFKRKIAELKKVLESNKFPKYSKEWLEKKKELNELEVKVNEAILHQSKNLFLELGTEALDKIESYITGLENGTNPANDRYMEYVIDTLDTWSNFEGTEPKVKELKRKAFPFIKKYNLEVAKSFAHNPDNVTQEAIDNDNLDIRKWFNLGSRYIGSLSDSQNILGRTIGFVIKEAQNIYSAKNKKERTEIQEQVTALFDYAKKAGIKPINIYNYFIQESNTTTVLVSEKLKDGTINPNWDKVQNTHELKRFYDFYRQKMSESQKRLPVKPGLNFIPNIQGESIKLFLNDLNPLKTKTVDGKVVTEEYLPEIVPLRYIKSIPANIKSKDLGNSLLAFVKQSHEFEQLSDVLPKVNILQEEIKNMQLPDGEVVPRKFVKASSPGKNVTVEGKDSDLYHMTESVKEMQVLKKMKTEQGSIEYGKNYDADGNPVEVKYFDTTDFVDNLLRLNSLVRIGFAPITAASNAIFGDASNLIEAIGGRFFNVKELGQATDIFFKQTFNKDSALNQILEDTNYLQSLDDYQAVEKGVGQLTREKMLEYAYGMQKAGEKYLQSRTLIAVMLRKGYITSKGEATKEWINISEKEKTRFINETQRLNQMIHGRYSQEEAATMYQNVIFRMVSQFRKWIPSAIERTVGKRQFDERLGVEVEGTFITFGNRVLGNWNNPYQAVENMILPLLDAKAAIKKGNLTELEVYNMRKMMVNILLGAATFLSYLLLHGGDDEEKKKWRKNPWIKTTLTLLNRVSGDLNLIYSPGSITQMAGTGAPVISLVDDMIDVVKFTFWDGLVYQDWTYKTGSRKGDVKALSKLGSVTPGVKPALDIKRLASDYSLEELR